MRIGIDVSILEDAGRTGVERYLAGLVRGLAELSPPMEISLFSRGPVDLGHSLPARMKMVPTGISRMPLAIWRELLLAPLARRLGCDIVHSGVSAIPMIGMGMARIATVHELTWLHVADPSRWLFKHRLRTAAAAMLADRIIVNSHHTQNDLASIHPRAASRIEVIYPGVERIFRPIADRETIDRARRRGRIPEGPFFLFVGRIEPKKNIDKMLDAMARLPGAARLVLVGKLGYPEPAFEALVARHGLSTRVIVAGYVTDEDLVALVSDAVALLYVSQMEGFGFPPLEAMACGTPAIVSDRGAIPEVVGDAALIVSADDGGALAAAMKRILDDGPFRNGLIARGQKRAAEFTFEAGAQKLLRLYQAAAERRC